MNSTAQMTDNNLDKLGRNRTGNMIKGLSTIYNMNLTAKMTDNNLDKLGQNRTGNMIKGLSTIYNTNSTNLLDTIVPDINVPIMKISERKPVKPDRFNSKNGSKMLSNKQVCR